MEKRKHYAMTLSRMAYNSLEEFTKEAEKIGFKVIDFIDKEGVQAFLVENKEGQTLVFRGSQNVKIELIDWVRNFDFTLKDTYIGKCHKGYFEVLMKYYDILSKKITDNKILITGHSQGGGLAIIYSKLLDYTGGFNTQCIAFEPPRITDTHHFHPKVFYTINNADIVPRLPLRAMDRRHTGTLIFFNIRGKAKENTRYISRIVQFLADIDDIVQDHLQDKVEKLWLKNIKLIDKILN